MGWRVLGSPALSDEQKIMARPYQRNRAAEGSAPESEPVSVFLTKAQLGDRDISEGGTVTLTIKSIDPEDGSVEAIINAGGAPEPQTSEEAFDQAIPLEEEV